MKQFSWTRCEEPYGMGEAQSLLLQVDSLAAPSYDSFPQDSRVSDETELLSVQTTVHHLADPSRARYLRNGTFAFALILSSSTIVMALLFFSTLFPTNTPFSQTVLSEIVLAPQVADASTTFQSLAQKMMPAWYQETVSNMPIFTATVLPGDVYKTRKNLLKTRDLLDVFSPVYPNTTRTSDGTNMWRLVRHYLNQGYMIVGTFQDLHNAHVMYSQEQMQALRDEVLEWRDDFAYFRETHNDTVKFLASPTRNSYRHKESRLFWKDEQILPSGGDVATDSLRMLGTKQLHRVLEYLWLANPYVSVLDEEAHVHYHNLRKELRSVVDEFELFGSIMYAITPKTKSAMKVLMRARKLLGDINDDWTAYSIYVENDEYYSEQTRLVKAIDDGWAYLQMWVHKSNFEGAVQYLLENLNPTMPEAVKPAIPSLNEFLQGRMLQPTNHIVIGNEAGDADSIVSAITLAYIESTQEAMQSTPIVSVPKADLATQRPEVKLLLELAGISNATYDLHFVDDPLIVDDCLVARVTLVDHNALAEQFQWKNWTVVEIVDHHEDEGLYLDTCSGTARTIAFADDKALVASACTLVAERQSTVWNPPYSSSIGLLLLGVILLDSVNLSPEVGKVTQRDRDAVANLLENTDWGDLPEKTQVALGMGLSSEPDPEAVFEMLQGAKYDSSFWRSLSVRDALRYDYKEYSPEGHQTFGVSTVLMPLQDFFHKDDVAMGVLEYMDEIDADFLGIMFAFEDDSRLKRQLALCGRNGFPLKDVDAFLHRSGYYHDLLDLKEIKDISLLESDPGLSLQFFNQRDVVPSRKQIGPILIEFFEFASSTEDQGVSDA